MQYFESNQCAIITQKQSEEFFVNVTIELNFKICLFSICKCADYILGLNEELLDNLY